MNQIVPRPIWRKPSPPKSLLRKIFTGLFSGLAGFFSVLPVPKNIPFLKSLSYIVRPLELKPEESKNIVSEQKVKELIKDDVSRQVAMWSEAADLDKSVAVYKVQSGDSLWKIAQLQYGNGMRWIDIWTANRIAIREPNLIFSGQELKLPKNIIRRTALFQTPQPPIKTAKITPAAETVKRQIISATDSIARLSVKTATLATKETAAQLNSNTNEARELSGQAGGISDLNSHAVDLAVRTLDLGRETIQLTQATAVTPTSTAAQIASTMAWSEDVNGNVKYYVMQNGKWVPNSVNPIGNIGVLYGTQDITQTPEYKSGKIIKIVPQPAPATPAVPAPPAPYGGAVLNTEEQKIYEKLQQTEGGNAAELYKQSILSFSPLAVAVRTAVAKMDNTALGMSVGNAITTQGIEPQPALKTEISAAANTLREIAATTEASIKNSFIQNATTTLATRVVENSMKEKHPFSSEEPGVTAVEPASIVSGASVSKNILPENMTTIAAPAAIVAGGGAMVAGGVAVIAADSPQAQTAQTVAAGAANLSAVTAIAAAEQGDAVGAASAAVGATAAAVGAQAISATGIFGTASAAVVGSAEAAMAALNAVGDISVSVSTNPDGSLTVSNTSATLGTVSANVTISSNGTVTATSPGVSFTASVSPTGIGVVTVTTSEGDGKVSVSPDGNYSITAPTGETSTGSFTAPSSSDFGANVAISIGRGGGEEGEPGPGAVVSGETGNTSTSGTAPGDTGSSGASPAGSGTGVAGSAPGDTGNAAAASGTATSGDATAASGDAAAGDGGVGGGVGGGDGSGGGDACVIAGTKIILADKTTPSIESLKIGMKAIVFDKDSNSIASKIVETLQHSTSHHPELFQIGTKNSLLILTGNHRVLTKNSWKRADEIRVNDQVYLYNQEKDLFEKVFVETVSIIQSQELLYTIRTDKENFIANGIVIHTE